MAQTRFPCLICLFSLVALSAVPEQAVNANEKMQSFFSAHCLDCHDQDAAEAGLDLSGLGTDLAHPETLEKWVRIFDRVDQQEMPPKDAEQPTCQERTEFLEPLKGNLLTAHESQKSAVLRRLNRREYENTLNDLFGTNLDLEGMLPADGRSHEFDTVGAALGLSMVQLQRYMQASGRVFDTALAKTTAAPKPKLIEASYRGTREATKFVGKVWKELPGGAIVRFSGGGYPSGMMRSAGIRTAGRYRVRVTGYAYQTKEPIAFSVAGTTFARGAEQPTFGFFSFPPDKSSSIEFVAWIEANYMIRIEPYGIADPERYKRKSIDDYKGPGLAIQSVVLEGPLVDQFPSRGHELVFAGLDRQEIPPRNPAERKKSWYKPKFRIESDNEKADATRSLTRVATAAFRRPVKEEEIAPYVKLFLDERAEDSTFEDSLRMAVSAIFCSPKFIYLQENAGSLDDVALAARLSYFLTRTQPDRSLRSAAESGQLAKPEGLLRQTQRLLQDARFDRFVTDFTEAWLNLREMDFTAPDQQLFPEFDPYLRHSMPLETEAFFRELVRSNLSVTNLVRSDFAMLNSRLAEHYELPPVSGAKIRKVKLPPDSMRGGLLSQASILKVTANGTNTSPVVRGVWVMERILGESPSPPPPGIPGVEPDIRGAQTLREVLDKHRNLASCNTCHKKIDPPGFALEVFNPIGGFRDRYRSIGGGDKVNLEVLGRRVRYRLGPSVDCSGKLPDGRAFADFKQFRDYLAKDEDALARTLAKKMLTFATGRELGFSDRAEIEHIVQQSAAKGHGIRDLIQLVVASKIFRTK